MKIESNKLFSARPTEQKATVKNVYKQFNEFGYLNTYISTDTKEQSVICVDIIICFSHKITSNSDFEGKRIQTQLKCLG